MKKTIAGVMLAAGMMIGSVGVASAGDPKGEAYGHWAGRLCDHVGPTTAGTTYWQSRGYSNRGQCVKLEGQSLQRGEWNPAAWPI